MTRNHRSVCVVDADGRYELCVHRVADPLHVDPKVSPPTSDGPLPGRSIRSNGFQISGSMLACIRNVIPCRVELACSIDPKSETAWSSNSRWALVVISRRREQTERDQPRSRRHLHRNRQRKSKRSLLPNRRKMAVPVGPA